MIRLKITGAPNYPATGLYTSSSPIPAIAIYGFDGFTTNYQLRVNSTQNLTATAAQGTALLVTGPGQWAINHNPGANTQATISKAADASRIHVCKWIAATFVNVAAAAGQVTLNLRDGATGAGTILISLDLAVPAVANSTSGLVITGLNIPNAAINTAMTLEFSAAGGANTREAVSFGGYTTI